MGGILGGMSVVAKPTLEPHIACILCSSTFDRRWRVVLWLTAPVTTGALAGTLKSTLPTNFTHETPTCPGEDQSIISANDFAAELCAPATHSLARSLRGRHNELWKARTVWKVLRRATR